jgi:hypothetical protein
MYYRGIHLSFRSNSLCLALLAVASLAPPAGAQPAPARAPAPAAGECPDGRIAEIHVGNHSVFDLTDSQRNGRFGWAYSLANGLHVRTRPDVIDREILFEVGDCFDVNVLRDSERLLRSFSFIADADLYGVRLPSGDVQVIVNTQDEWSTRIEPRVASNGAVGLRGLRLVEDNLIGTGRHLSLFYDRDEEERIYGLGYSTPHLFKTRWNMAMRMARTQVGYSLHESITYPFVGETGRVAFRQALDRHERYFELLMPNGEEDLTRIWVPVRREQFEFGGAVRWGAERYRHTLFGAALAGERISYPLQPTFAEPEESDPLALRSPAMRWHPVSNVRLMMLTGQRNVHYIRRHGLDTVSGTEDVKLGVEAEASFGPTLPLVSDDRDVAVGLGLFAAGEMASAVIAGGQFSFEGRRGYRSIANLPEWNDVLAEVDLWAYVRPSPTSNHLFVGALTALGGWHGRVPFQLTLGGDAGLRGYQRHLDPGGRRVVASLEHRANLRWPLPTLFDLGTVAFMDVGRIWPGHVAFGTASPIRASVGAGIRAGFPPGSRQIFRLDVGLPVERNANFRNLTVTVGVGQAIGRQSVRRDPQLLRSARYGLSTSKFISAGSP